MEQADATTPASNSFKVGQLTLRGAHHCCSLLDTASEFTAGGRLAWPGMACCGAGAKLHAWCEHAILQGHLLSSYFKYQRTSIKI
jgi:hypothetical protein